MTNRQNADCTAPTSTGRTNSGPVDNMTLPGRNNGKAKRPAAMIAVRAIQNPVVVNGNAQVLIGRSFILGEPGFHLSGLGTLAFDDRATNARVSSSVPCSRTISAMSIAP